MAEKHKGNRKQEILQTLAEMLETHAGERITTAALAEKVGVSEAALYRHFPSKAKMYESLLDFIEDTIFGLVNQILKKERSAEDRCEKVVTLLLNFAAANPGMTSLLTGTALVGETERLRIRTAKFHERVETQLKQILRDGELHAEFESAFTSQVSANLIMAYVEGRFIQFVRSEFTLSPQTHAVKQWAILKNAIFNQAQGSADLLRPE